MLIDSLIEKRYTESYRKQLERAERARAVLRKKVSKPERGFLGGVGYNSCCLYYSPGFAPHKFLGSSLNRKFRKDERNSYEKKLASQTESFAYVAGKRTQWTIDEWAVHEWEMERYKSLIYSKASTSGGNKKDSGIVGVGVSGALSEPEQRLHVLSAKSRGKVRDKATAFYRSAGTNKTFVTLTFVATVSDNSGVSILNTFLTQIRKKYSNLEYLWVCERQSETGNIHFHMICNRRLPVATYNPLWVMCQYNAGLVGKNKNGFDIPIEVVRAAYKAKTIGKIFNPFDIKRVRSINNLSMYLTKYIVKQDKDASFGCANWHCSRGVSRLFTKSICGVGTFEKLKGLKNYRVDKSTGEMSAPKVESGKFWLTIVVNNKDCIIEDLREMELLNKGMLAGENLMPNWKHLAVIDQEDYRKYYLSPWEKQKILDHAN